MRSERLPRSVVMATILTTLIFLILSLLGWGVDYSSGWLSDERIREMEIPPESVEYYNHSGPFLHTILEWTSVCTAIFTGVLSIVHYRLKRDVTTPIIGTALFFSGMLDAFQIMAADQLITRMSNLDDFIPFAWVTSRTFNVAILTAGTLPFLVRKSIPKPRPEVREARYLILVGVLFGLVAYCIVHLFATVLTVPESLYPELTLSRPWETIPFIMWLILGIGILPKFCKKHPSLFSESLVLCAFPAAASHLVAGFGSKELFDPNFFNAYMLKIVAYGTPLIGLMLDYKNAYRAEMELEKTASKLDAARQIQQSLLPANHPDFPGVDAAGFSYASEAVGGDYYDYMRLADGRFAFVVGDVSGHDLAASLLAAQTRAYLRAYANSHATLDEIVDRLNHALILDTQHRRFVTMFVGAIDENRKGFRFVAAGHQGYLIRADGKIETLDSNSLPIGMSSDNKIEVQHIERIHEGDTILIVTDGITEALSPKGEQYGLQRLLDFLSVEHERDVREIAERLHGDVDRFCCGARPTDDVTVLLVRWTEEVLP